MSWDEEKNIYVKKLKRIIDGIDKIRNIRGNRIVTSEMDSLLQRLQSDAECLLPKLEKGEFEIAVVGLEKAGKSSFSNALIGLEALPTADERCTFTSTCIRPGEENSADVSFYSRQEFDRNFRENLEELGIPDAQLYTIDNLSPDRYEQLYEKCDKTKKQLYERSLNQDIRTTLRYKEELQKYIGSSMRHFFREELKSDSFRFFITNPGRAIAVKEVVIHSAEMQDMPNAVMYDVPGFNSPTAMHEEQTLERMQAADAIIMVAKAHEPTLTAEVLKIFKKSDVDGSYLSDKLFVFSNKADYAADLEKNKKTTYEEWIRNYKILPDSDDGRDRIVFGSATAFLSDTAAREVLEEKGIENGGIPSLRKKLQTYYQTTRFEVLKKRINKILVDVQKLFSDVGTEATNSSAYNSAEKYKIVMNLQKELSENIRRNLEDLKDSLNKEATENRPLTTDISAQIRDLVTVENYKIEQEELDRLHKEKNGIGLAQLPAAIDIAIREQRFTRMYDDFMDKILSCTGSRHCEVRSGILEIFLNAMHLDRTSGERDRLETEVKNLCNLEHDQDDGYYQSLIERFGRDVFEAQIKRSQGVDRLEKFKAEVINFISLGVFYRAPGAADEPVCLGETNSPVWRLLLYPEKAVAASNAASKEEIVQKLQKWTGIQKVTDSVSKYIDRVMLLKGPDALEVLETAFLSFVAKGKPEAVVFDSIKTVFEKILEDSNCDSIALQDVLTGNRYLNDIDQKHSNFSYEQVGQEFSDDIRALQLVLQNAVVPAVNIDKAFIAREAKLIEDIINMLKGNKPNDDRFIDFVSRNAELIEASKFGRMKEEENQRALDSAVINEIQTILVMMDGQIKE